jgi:hypothetical protein
MTREKLDLIEERKPRQELSRTKTSPSFIVKGVSLSEHFVKRLPKQNAAPCTRLHTSPFMPRRNI